MLERLILPRWVACCMCRRVDDAVAKITPHLRMPLLTVRDIMKVVKPSGIVDSKQWLEALDYIAAVSEHSVMSSCYTQGSCFSQLYRYWSRIIKPSKNLEVELMYCLHLR